MAVRPNILFIMTDQQSRHMMSCAGNSHLDTPAMDSMAASGVRFTRAYCTNPVCVPSRFGLFTGLMPSAIGLCNNGPVLKREALPEAMTAGLGWALKDGGYRPVYAGKQHLPRMSAEDLGFEVLTMDERDELAKATAKFVSTPHQTPWCLVASFINPHDICYMAIREHAEGDAQRGIMGRATVEITELDAALESALALPEDAFDTVCPPLPANHEPQVGEPEALRELLAQRPFRANARGHWDERRWRLHRWAYARLTERVDGQIQILLDALRSGPSARNTVVIFTSDHGDHDASHKMEHKTFPYEEAAGVPFIVCPPNGCTASVDDTTLVSNGLDIYPTICDYAGIGVPAHVTGVSLRSIVEGHTLTTGRTFVPIETEVGNAVVGPHHKYLVCASGGDAEQLYDLANDPHEMRNAANDPEQSVALAMCRRQFKGYFENEKVSTV